MDYLNFILKRCVLPTLLLGISWFMKAQGVTAYYPVNGDTYKPNIGISAPQTSDFVRYGNLDIEHYNGLLNLEIPLNGYTDNDFDLPMSMKYISSGFMPGKRPSVVGQNWLLRFGGVITRNVKGSPDDTKGNANRAFTDYMKDGLLVAIRNKTYTGGTPGYFRYFIMPVNTKAGYIWGDVEHDFEPDIFQFSFGRHSGRFIIGNNCSPLSLDGQGYKIDISGMTIQEYSLTAAPVASTIKITTPDGYVYQFGGDVSYLEYFFSYEYTLIAKKPRHITAWYLKSIQAPNGREVKFEYESKLLPALYDYFSYTYTTNGTDSQRKARIEESTYSPVLRKVQFDNGIRIEFGTQSGPEFYKDNDRSVIFTQISHFQNSEKIKETVLSYTTKGRYIFLARIKKDSEVYHFKYNFSFTSPHPLTASLDHWGFWNGEDTTLPENLISYCMNEIEQVRNSSGNCFDAGLLTSVVYPTGGITRIKYEPNVYNKFLEYNLLNEGLLLKSSSTGTLCGGARVKEIADSIPTGERRYNLRTFQYTTSFGTSSPGSGVIGIRPKYKAREVWIRNDAMITHTDVSCNSLGRNENISEYHIGYSDVIEKFSDNSYIHYNYSSNVDICNTSAATSDWIYRGLYYGASQLTDLEIRVKGDLYRTNDMSQFRGKLQKKEYYNTSGTAVRSETYTYNRNEVGPYFNVSVATSARGKCAYNIYLTPCILKKKEVVDEKGVIQTETYKHNDKMMISEQQSMNSNGDNFYVRYKYASDYPYNSLGVGEKALFDRNMLDKPLSVDKVMLANDASDKVLESLALNYKIENSQPVLSDMKKLIGSNWVTIMEYPKYDLYGNPVYTIENRALHTVYLWGNTGQHLIAKMGNTTYSNVATQAQTIGLDINRLVTASGSWDIDKLNMLRTLMPKARITTYTHKPLIGVGSITDPRGFRINYDYDDSGRLKSAHFNDENSRKAIIESHRYNYMNK